jgi:hypothetical protein
MNRPVKERQIFRPSLWYLIPESVSLALIVVLWWGSRALLIAVFVLATAITVTRWRYSIVVTESEVIEPRWTPFRRRSRVRVSDAVLKPSDWSRYPYEIGSSTGDDRIAVWMLGKTEREALFRALSIDVPKDQPTS